MDYVKLIFEGQEIQHRKGETLETLANYYSSQTGKLVLAAKIENTIVELFTPVTFSGRLEFLDFSHQDGSRIYQRGLTFLLDIAVRKVFPNTSLKVLHSIGNGIYCEIRKNGEIVEITDEDIQKIKQEIKKLVEKNYRFTKHTFRKSEANEIFLKSGKTDKVKLLQYRKKKTVKVYELNGNYGYFYGYMPPSTGYLKWFDLIKHLNGFVLMLPNYKNREIVVSEFKPFPKLSTVFIEYGKWLEIMEIDNVGDLNNIIASGERSVTDLIILTEALHEKRIAMISEEIKSRKDVRLVLIAGPSSSGKTTFSKRLMVQLKASGLKPVTISLDDYFVDREKTPRDEEGNYDFEVIEALDVELFNKNLLDLFDGKEVEIPKFDFHTGSRMKTGTHMKIEKDDIIIVEGIHGLNPKLTELVSDELKFKIYASALTQINIDNLNRMQTTDVRLLRRMVRDSKFRGHTAVATLRMWPSVRRGEDKNIFPYQENADIMFNSALVYEISVLKVFAEQLLASVPDEDPTSTEANRLLKLLDYFLPITNIEDIPRTSIIREFIGRSAFRY